VSAARGRESGNNRNASALIQSNPIESLRIVEIEKRLSNAITAELHCSAFP
jgi:hypothetical protein